MHSSTLLRYPGGKQRLTPFILSLLKANDLLGCDYVEPYAGGAGVAMKLLFSGCVERVHLNDKCPQLYQFWCSLKRDPLAFASRIAGAKLDLEEWKRMRHIVNHYRDYDVDSVGFAFFYLNRTNFSGIISGGLIGGQAQKGNYKMDARFNRDALAELAKRYVDVAHRIELYNEDAVDFLRRVSSLSAHRLFVYCDPPYYHKGQQLYLNAYEHGDHALVASVLRDSVKGVPWVVSYDAEASIAELYRGFRQYSFDLQYSAKGNAIGKELFILGDDVQFLDGVTKQDRIIGRMNLVELA